ncbi:hypothetical protein F4604DRAFT_1933364 [Suillus subluteus]|nr:hypothetical protein F4604DRAFT_1933364 [Suillus subluteus]
MTIRVFPKEVPQVEHPKKAAEPKALQKPKPPRKLKAVNEAPPPYANEGSQDLRQEVMAKREKNGEKHTQKTKDPVWELPPPRELRTRDTEVSPALLQEGKAKCALFEL